jgi:Uma2 family endonuclease
VAVMDVLIHIPEAGSSAGFFTVKDLMALPETDQYQLELHEGVIRVVPPANPEHNAAQLDLVIHFRALGRKVYTEMGIQLNDRSYRVPDVSVLRPDRTVTSETLQSPDIVEVVVEVVSPTSVDEDRLIKAKVYADACIPEYWRVERTTVGRVVVQSHLRDGRYVTVREVPLDELLAGGGGLV